MSDSASFGDWIRRRRKALDLTREALARQVGCAVVTIRKIESDERRPSRQVAERLAECLQILPPERAAFLQAARAELAVDRLPTPAPPTSMPLPGAPGPAAEPLAQPPAPNIATPGLLCPSCGAAVAADRRFCGQCGIPIRQLCSACGVENPAGTRFCSACGSALGSAAPMTAASGTESVTAAPREERRWVTVLFADLAGFTAMSEQLDPEDVKALIARCVEEIGEQVRRLGGTVVNVMGDGVLAVFGAPLAHEDDATRAVRAAMVLRETAFSNDPTDPLTLHIGINTGEVLATVHGPAERRDYTVLGDTVNTADRILRAAPAGSVLVGEETYRATRHAVQYRELSPVVAKGKERPIRVWEALTVTMIPEARPLGAAPLIGRNEELDRLLRMWTRVARDAQPHLVTVLGEPGIGKSRLVGEFMARLPSEAQVLHGRCLPYGTTLGYWALAAMLKTAASITVEDEAETARAKLSALVAAVIPAKTGDPHEVALHLALLTGLDTATDRTIRAGDQRARHASARRFLEACASQRPLCLIFEDIHWADDALLDLIESVAAHVREAPLLIVTQARPELLENRAAWGRGVRSSTSLPLSPLPAAQERDLLLALCRERGLPETTAAQIGHGPGGNPLFAEEIVAMIAERGQVSGVPSMIKMLIAARLDALPLAERSTLQFAAIFGKVFWEGGLQALGNDSTHAIRDHLEVLEQKDLLRAQVHSQFRDDHEYAFKHDLIRDVAYEMLPKSERRSLHGRVADWLEQREEQFFDLLAHHAVQAGQQQRAIDYLIQAAERANSAAAHRQAAAIFSEALTIAESIGQHDVIADLYAKRGTAFNKAGLWASAKPDLEIALSKLALEQVEQRTRVLIDLAVDGFWLLDISSVRRYASEAQTLAEQLGHSDLAAGALAHLALAEQSDGNLLAALRMNEQAVAQMGGIAPILGPAPAEVGLISFWLGRSEEAIQQNRDAMQVYRKWNDTALCSLSYEQWGLALAASGRYTEAAQVFAEAIQFSREYEVRPLLARAIAMSAGFHLDLFDYAGNEALAEEAREIAYAVNWPPPAVSAGIDLLLNFARRQEVGRAESLLPEIAAIVERTGGFHGWLWRLRLAEARAEIALARGDWDETMRYADSAIQQSRARGRVKYHILGLDTRAKALLEINRPTDALAGLREALTLASSLNDPAVFLRPATTLLSVEGDDTLLHETHAIVQRIIAEIPNEEMRRLFEVAEPVQRITTLIR